ncbi:hypothetical protein D3C76_972830 [compost metagenome]
METGLCQIVVGASIQATPSVFLTVLVRHHHHRQRLQALVAAHQGDQLDAIHARHVDIGDQQVEVVAAQRVPAVHAIYRHRHVVTAVAQQLALQLAHGERVVDHQNALARCATGATAAALDALQAAGTEQFFHRAQQVFDVDDQHHRAVVEQGTGGDVLDLAQARVEGHHHQHPLADQAFYGNPVELLALADHHHPQAALIVLPCRAVEQLACRHQADVSPFVPEVLAPFDLHDLFGGHLQGAFDMRQREGIRFAAHLHHQAAHHRQGQRHLQVEAAALPRQLRQLDRAAQLADHVLHGIQANPAPRHLGHGVAQAETGQEQERHQLRLAHPGHRVGRRHGTLDDSAAQALKVDTGAIVDQL